MFKNQVTKKFSEEPRKVILKGGKHVKGNLVLRLNHPRVIFFFFSKICNFNEESVNKVITLCLT